MWSSALVRPKFQYESHNLKIPRLTEVEINMPILIQMDHLKSYKIKHFLTIYFPYRTCLREFQHNSLQFDKSFLNCRNTRPNGHDWDILADWYNLYNRIFKFQDEMIWSIKMNCRNTYLPPNGILYKSGSS